MNGSNWFSGWPAGTVISALIVYSPNSLPSSRQLTHCPVAEFSDTPSSASKRLK